MQLQKSLEVEPLFGVARSPTKIWGSLIIEKGRMNIEGRLAVAALLLVLTVSF